VIAASSTRYHHLCLCRNDSLIGFCNIQYDNLNIGEGCIIRVCRASFTPPVTKKEETNQSQESDPPVSIHPPRLAETRVASTLTPAPCAQVTPTASYTETVYYSSDSAPNKLRDALPPECLANTHPIALLSKVYDPSDVDSLTDPNFFCDLEVRHVCDLCNNIYD
jgi:hypothetical protein